MTCPYLHCHWVFCNWWKRVFTQCHLIAASEGRAVKLVLYKTESCDHFFVVSFLKFAKVATYHSTCELKTVSTCSRRPGTQWDVGLCGLVRNVARKLPQLHTFVPAPWISSAMHCFITTGKMFMSDISQIATLATSWLGMVHEFQYFHFGLLRTMDELPTPGYKTQKAI